MPGSVDCGPASPFLSFLCTLLTSFSSMLFNVILLPIAAQQRKELKRDGLCLPVRRCTAEFHKDISMPVPL